MFKKKKFFFIDIVSIFLSIVIQVSCENLKLENSNYSNHDKNNTASVCEVNDKLIINSDETTKKNRYSVDVFDYDKLGSKKSWLTSFLKNDFWNSYYTLSSASANPWHLIAFPINFVVTNVSKLFFGENVNTLLFQKLNLLVPEQTKSPEFYSYLESNIKQDIKAYEQNICDNKDIAEGIGASTLIDFRNEFQKQIATEGNNSKFLIDRLNNFIDNYEVKHGVNLEKYYKNTLKYKILTKLGLKDSTFEEQRTREFLFTYLKTSIMFSLDAKYSYEYTIFRNNFFCKDSKNAENDFVQAFSNFKNIFEKNERYKDTNFYDVMDYFAWKIASDNETDAVSYVPDFAGDSKISGEDKIIPGTLSETNKIFSNSSEYEKINFCLKCGALGQKLVRWSVSGTALCISYKVILAKLMVSGLFWSGASFLLGSMTSPVIAGILLEKEKTKNFSKFMKENFAKDIRNEESVSMDLLVNDEKLSTKRNFNNGKSLNNGTAYDGNLAKTNAKLFSIVKYQEKMICESSDKNVAVKVPVLKNIMNSYKNYIVLNKNSSKTIKELTKEFKQKLRENDFDMIRKESANESGFIDKFTKNFSKVFNAAKSFFIGDGESSYVNYQAKYEYVSDLIDSVESYTMIESYHNATLNMYDAFVNYEKGENFAEFFENSWKTYLNPDIGKNLSDNALNVVKKEFYDYAMEHIIIDGLYMSNS